MKQGMTKRKLPKDKHEKESWKKRNVARKDKQEAHIAQLIDSDEQAEKEAKWGSQ